MTWSTDIVVRVWDDKNGDRVDVCDDGDSLGLIEVRNVTDDGKVSQRVTFPLEAADQVVAAIQRVKAELEKST